MTTRSLLCRALSHSAAACALLFGSVAAPAGAAGSVLDVIVFGDSSADLGSEGPARRPTNLGEMWSERLARAVGRSSTNARSVQINEAGTGIDIIRTGGNSYAVNGSTALPFDCCLTFAQQVDFFVQDRTRFSGNELVFTWFTRNDITTAFTDGIPADGVAYSADRYANAYATQVDRLRALGGFKSGVHCLCEPLTEQDGHLRLGRRPFTGRHFPLFPGPVQDQEQQFQRRVVIGEMPPGADGAAGL